MERRIRDVSLAVDLHGDDGCDLDDLLHPAQAFEHPSSVVNDPDLTLNEKRAILASWASDACAVEAAPELRSAPHGSTVRFDDIMEALRSLDKQANGDKYRRVLHRRRIFGRNDRSGQGNTGTPLQ
jgi:hypothetical protein